jgi:raffinose/stachyose/melibiose transport system permease protein
MTKLTGRKNLSTARSFFRHQVSLGPNYLVLFISLGIAILPLLFIFFTAFKSTDEIARTMFLPPETWRLDNFIQAWTYGHFSKFFFNSVVVIFPVVVVSTLFSIFSGYAFAKLKFLLDEYLFIFLLIGMIVPQEAFVLPLYNFISKIGLHNTYWAMILPSIGMSVCFGTFWMRSFYTSLPKDLIDAAKVDGCNNFSVILKIALPMAIPAITTLVVLLFIWTWNDFLIPLIMVSTDDYRTLPLGLAFFQGRYTSDISLISAGAVIVALPTVIIYFLFQRQFIRGIVAGSMTGT